MYFWNIKALKAEIKSGNFGDKEAISYIVVTIFLYMLDIELTERWGPLEIRNIWNTVNSILCLLITVFGTIYAYSKNGGAQGKNFANKFFAISFVTGIHFLVYFLGVMILMLIYWDYVFPDTGDISTTPFEVFVYTVWYGALYYVVGKHMEDTVE